MGTHPKPAGDPDALATLLREGTSVNHREAERRPFMRVFFKGELPKDAYVGWMQRQWRIYSQLEESQRELAGHPIVGPMVDERLFRTARIEADLDELSPQWRSTVDETPATKAYVDRIAWSAEEFPEGFVAHVWLRYMGNIGGAHILRRLIASSTGLASSEPGTPGLLFADYTELGEVGPFFGSFHGRMNAMTLDAETKQRVVEEADLGFRLNMQLTDELAEDFAIEAPEGHPDQEYEALQAEH